MSSVISRDEAWKLLTEYNKEHFHLKHAVTVEGVMRYFAKELGYADEVDLWGIVGLLHDLDFEIVHAYPCRNIVKLREDMLNRRVFAQDIDTVLTAELVCQCR